MATITVTNFPSTTKIEQFLILFGGFGKVTSATFIQPDKAEVSMQDIWKALRALKRLDQIEWDGVSLSVVPQEKDINFVGIFNEYGSLLDPGDNLNRATGPPMPLAHLVDRRKGFLDNELACYFKSHSDEGKISVVQNIASRFTTRAAEATFHRQYLVRVHSTVVLLSMVRELCPELVRFRAMLEDLRAQQQPTILFTSRREVIAGWAAEVAEDKRA